MRFLCVPIVLDLIFFVCVAFACSLPFLIRLKDHPGSHLHYGSFCPSIFTHSHSNVFPYKFPFMIIMNTHFIQLHLLFHVILFAANSEHFPLFTFRMCAQAFGCFSNELKWNDMVCFVVTDHRIMCVNENSNINFVLHSLTIIPMNAKEMVGTLIRIWMRSDGYIKRN